MKLYPIHLDPDFMATLNHPLVQAYIAEGVEINENCIECIYDAIEYAGNHMSQEAEYSWNGKTWIEV